MGPQLFRQSSNQFREIRIPGKGFLSDAIKWKCSTVAGQTDRGLHHCPGHRKKGAILADHDSLPEFSQQRFFQ
jgi:hypothetical protein